MSENDPRRNFLWRAAGLGAVAASTASAMPAGAAAASVYSVTAYGASGDGARLDTKAIQSAVDACAAAGGGTVLFPAGAYLSGTVFLKSKVQLCLDAGAVLLGSKNLDDYPKSIPRIRSYTDNYTEKSLIYGEGLHDIGIHGRGLIDGQGASFEGPYKVRPYLIRIISCRSVSVSGVTIRNSPMWVQHYLACDDVSIHGITVHSRVNHNNDGIDIDCCHRVTISDSNISSGDDAIVLKSTSARPTTDVAITNCVLSSRSNAFKLGTESNGGFENIVLSNCTMYDTRLSGIAVEMVDGGLLDGLSVSNVTMRDVKSALFVRLGNRARPYEAGGPRPGAGKLRNVHISNVTATGANDIGCAISGIPGHEIENVTLENIRFTFEGGVKDAPVKVPEHPAEYPEYKMFGLLPAYGFFCRHVRNISFRNVQTGFDRADARPALVCEDVRDLDIGASCFAASGPTIKLRQVSGAMIHGCRVPGRAAAFLDVSGGQVERVSVIGNDLSNADKAVEGAADSVFLEANRRKT